MKYNVISYFFGEGFRNVFKNKKSTFSCLGVMCATMFMFGLFFAVSQNVNNMISEIEDAQAIRVFAVLEASEEEKDTLVLMTCAGEDLGNGDSTHRLLVTATAE